MLLVDTGVWLAAADRRSRLHDECASVLRDHRGDLAASVAVVAESAWLILDRLGPGSQSEFVRMVVGGDVEVLELKPADWQRCAELIETYADLRLDLMDASTVALAERLGLTKVATLDQRDFTVVRPRHVDAFELIP